MLAINHMVLTDYSRTSALRFRIDQKASKLNIFASYPQKFVKFSMNTINGCSYLLTMDFLKFIFKFVERKIFFLSWNFSIRKTNNKTLKLQQQVKHHFQVNHVHYFVHLLFHLLKAMLSFYSRYSCKNNSLTKKYKQVWMYIKIYK